MRIYSSKFVPTCLGQKICANWFGDREKLEEERTIAAIFMTPSSAFLSECRVRSFHSRSCRFQLWGTLRKKVLRCHFTASPSWSTKTEDFFDIDVQKVIVLSRIIHERRVKSSEDIVRVVNKICWWIFLQIDNVTGVFFYNFRCNFRSILQLKFCKENANILQKKLL